jgi:hypothetical protein
MADLKTLVTSLYDLLEPADPADRKKAIKAVMTMLGDTADVGSEKPGKPGDDEVDDSDFHAKAKSWMKKYVVTAEQLGHVFQVENGVAEVVAHEAPGTNTKQKTINAYVLTGIGQLLATGEAKFDDKAGRASCKAMGCLNEGNHATYMKDKGNVMGGSKDGGWTLTGPGLKSGADLVKGLAGGS